MNTDGELAGKTGSKLGALLIASTSEVATIPVKSVAAPAGPFESTAPAAEVSCATPVFERTADTASAAEVGKIEPAAAVSCEAAEGLSRPPARPMERETLASGVGNTSTEADRLAPMLKDNMGGTEGVAWTTPGRTTAKVEEGWTVGSAVGSAATAGILLVGSMVGIGRNWRASSSGLFSQSKSSINC